MSNSLNRLVPLTLFLALAVSNTISAQTEGTADLSGVVLDASGKPAAGYPLKLSTAQWGEVIIRATEEDGGLAANGLPPGTYEVRVFKPGGSEDKPIASKQVTLTAGQKAKIEIRLNSDHSGVAAAGGAAGGASLDSMGVNWSAIVIAAMVLGAVLLVFFSMRSQRRAGA